MGPAPMTSRPHDFFFLLKKVIKLYILKEDTVKNSMREYEKDRELFCSPFEKGGQGDL